MQRTVCAMGLVAQLVAQRFSFFGCPRMAADVQKYHLTWEVRTPTHTCEHHSFDRGSSGRRFKSCQPDTGQRHFPENRDVPFSIRAPTPVPQRAGVRRCSPVISLGLYSIGSKEASASRRSRIARAWSMGIRPIEDAWAAVAFRDPGSVHADRTVVTQAAREIEICASH